MPGEEVTASKGRARTSAAGGLRVERVWTTEGVHPYDEVTWERRDVVMTNWRDGSINFEQRGVEFPDFWSVNAANIVTTKYFRGAMGTPEREWSLKQLIDRVVKTYRAAGEQHGYFATLGDAEIFEHELTWMLLHQVFSFNSPVWFNVGTSSPAQVSACFILSVDDSMDSILNWYKEEGLIFKGGSGSGVNLSRIRSSKELLSSGGTASGPVSFMRGADASAGTIKSGGATRRAAKMVILDVDHPDIEEFVLTKAREENKIRALRDAGFDMDLGGADIVSVQYQNANNSVRVSDEFMRAVDEAGSFDLRGRLDGSLIETVDAKGLFRTIAQAAWECADPGLQYDDTINDWHTCPETGRITASNPCFTGDTLVHTDKGLIRFDDLIDRSRAGESFGVYTHDATNPEAPADRIELTRPEAVMITGTNEIVRLEFSNGMVLRCTPNHRIWTTNRGYVEAQELTETDRVLPLNLPTPAVAASREFRLLPGTQVSPGDVVPTKWQRESRLPEKWTEEFAHLLGWLTGDGCVRRGTPGVRGDNDTATWIYSQEDRDAFLSRHQAVLAEMVGFMPKPSEQQNGTVQLRAHRRDVVEFLSGLGVSTGRAAEKRVPTSVLQAPSEIQAEFLKGLFDADGCAGQTSNDTRYVGLGSVSVELLRDVQRQLSCFGIGSRIYETRKQGDKSFTYTTVDGDERSYTGGKLYDLRISGKNIAAFAAAIGFSHPRKAERLATWLRDNRFYRTDQTATLVSRELDGFETTYNLSEPRNHSYIANGVVVRNCSEYLHLDNSSCNLASLNLMKFLRADGGFEVQKFVRSVELVITAMDISICFADFPTEKIGETTRAYRQLGIGYANLGALLMASGLPYDSEDGRSLAAVITSLMTGTAYRRSAELAGIVGPYEGYARNAEPHKRVMRKHAAANDEIKPSGTVATAIVREATKQWTQGNKVGDKNGWRNAQASVLAPTGCLTADTLVTTDRGLMRLGEIGEVYGDRWQDLDLRVSTDEGPRQATKFFINGEEPTRRIVTDGGYKIQGTLAHRIKIVDPATGEWVWKRMADIEPGDRVPVQLATLVGERRRVPLPVLDQAYYAGDRRLHVPDEVDADLAELVGYFMGDGSLHAKGIRLCVADTDLDVVERLRVLSKGLFGLEPVVTARVGYQEVILQSVRLARWWQAAGFAKTLPHADHTGKGWSPRVPSAILETNDVTVYAAFLRGLFEADGSVTGGVPSLSTSTEAFADEVRTVLLALGIASTTRRTVSGFGGDIWQVRIRNQEHAAAFEEIVGFLSDRKAALVVVEPQQSGNRERIMLPRAVWDELVPARAELRNAVLQSLRKHGAVARSVAMKVYGETRDPRLAHALGYLFETVAANEDGGVQPTYDLSVPENVTYVAAGFVSHNTIGLMMDCDTTGVEPDLALVKFKKLVGGGSMQIVNQTVPRALRSLGYPEEQVEAIVEHIADHGHVVDAPGLKPEHYAVFDCAMGERSIAPMGHVRMMAAVQPFISGAISKCLVGDTLVASGEGLIRIGSLYRDEAEDTFREERLEISSLDGYRKTDAFYYGGVRPVRKVTLRSGHTITGTYPHRLLVAVDGGLTWKTLGEIQPGDYVATQYGAEMWATVPASLRDVEVSVPYGNQKPVTLPHEMSEELALLLGAYVAEGHITHSTWTVTITNSVEAVLERVRDAWRAVFGVEARFDRQPGKCPAIVISSKAIVEFLMALGCGARASEKRIPDAVLRSPRSMVLAFLQGLALDAYVTMSTAPKWAICLDSPALLDDLQAVLTNLGIVHGRVNKYNAEYDKSYGEVYAPGFQGQLMMSLVPFLEPEKAAAAARFLARSYGPGTSDVVPGVTGHQLHELIPPGTEGRGGAAGDRGRFAFLLDPHTKHVTRRTVERVASLPGVVLPQWLREVLDGNLHFSPVESVVDAGQREVFDLSVPQTHAFVANGIMNHNTVNMPESATVEDVEKIYFEGWKLGLKALAIYRDNCKVGQPLSAAKREKAAEPAKDTAKAEPAKAVEKVVEYRPVRKRLPKKRPSETVSFSVGGAEGYLTASSYPDDGLGEVFLKMSKQGSTLAGVMDAFSVAISIGLQYGVPLETYVSKFTNMRFEPAGMTDDPDIRMAASVMDYIFRRLALDFLPYERRAELGIFTAQERAAQLRAEAEAEAEAGVDLTAMASSAPVQTPVEAKPEPAADQAVAVAKPAPRVGSSTELLEAVIGKAADAPLCFTCGTKMRPAGSCYVCEGCGSTSGCS